jgi:spore maturation protein CgeB
MSRLLVQKIFDIMACDTMVMYPRFPDDASKNMPLFKDRNHIVYYDLGFFADNGQQVSYYLEHPEEVERIAHAGGEFVRSKYTLESMLSKMLSPVANENHNKVRV